MLNQFKALSRFSIDQTILKLKKELFTFKSNMQMCLSDLNKPSNLILVNHIINEYLTSSVLDSYNLLTRVDTKEEFKLVENLLTIPQYLDDPEFITQFVAFLETYCATSHFKETLPKLIEIAKNTTLTEVARIKLLLLFQSQFNQDRQLTQEFNDALFPRTLLIELIDEPDMKLDTDQQEQLESITDPYLIPYARLFLSRIKEQQNTKQSVNPELLLRCLKPDMPLSQLQFVIAQIKQTVGQMHGRMIHKFLQQLCRLPGNIAIKELVQHIYIHRLDTQHVNHRMASSTLQPFTFLMLNNQLFNDYRIHAKQLRIAIEVYNNHDYTYEQVIQVFRNILKDLHRLSTLDPQLFDKFAALINSPEYQITKQQYQAMINDINVSSQMSSIFVINLLRLREPDEYFNKYLRTHEPTQQNVRALLIAINQSSVFWKSSSAQDDLPILIKWVHICNIKTFKSLSLTFLLKQPLQLVSQFIRGCCDLEDNQSLYAFVHDNHLFLQQNQIQEMGIILPQQFIDTLVSDLLSYFASNSVENCQIMKDATPRGLNHMLSAIQVLNDVNSIIEPLKGFLKIRNNIKYVDAAIRSGHQIRKLLQGSEIIKQFKGESNYIDVFLQSPPLFKKITTTGGIDDIIVNKQNSKLLDKKDKIKLKEDLIKQLSTLNQLPTPAQAYELIMGWKAIDFDDYTYWRLLQSINGRVQLFDYLHLYKLMDKLVQQRKSHNGLYYKIYEKAQQTLNTNLQSIRDPLPLVQVCDMLLQMYPELQFKLSPQKSQLGSIINAIISLLQHDQQTAMEYQDAVQFNNPIMLQFKKYYYLFYDGPNQSNFIEYFTEFDDQLESAIFIYNAKLPVNIDTYKLQQAYEQNTIKITKQLKLACLVAMSNLKHNTQMHLIIRKHLQLIDPNSNYLFTRDMQVLYNVINEIFPRDPPLNKLELISSLNIKTYEPYFIRYLLTEPVSSMQMINTIEKSVLGFK